MTPLVRHHYILVITPHDQIFVGPFDSAEEAHRYNDTNVWHDGYVMSEAEMRDNIAEHGPCPIQAPEAQ